MGSEMCIRDRSIIIIIIAGLRWGIGLGIVRTVEFISSISWYAYSEIQRARIGSDEGCCSCVTEVLLTLSRFP